MVFFRCRELKVKEMGREGKRGGKAKGVGEQ